MLAKRLQDIERTLLVQAQHFIKYDLIRARHVVDVLRKNQFSLLKTSDQFISVVAALNGDELKRFLTANGNAFRIHRLVKDIELRIKYLEDPSRIGKLDESTTKAHWRLLRNSRSGLVLTHLYLFSEAANKVNEVEITQEFNASLQAGAEATALANKRHGRTIGAHWKYLL